MGGFATRPHGHLAVSEQHAWANPRAPASVIMPLVTFLIILFNTFMVHVVVCLVRRVYLSPPLRFWSFFYPQHFHHAFYSRWRHLTCTWALPSKGFMNFQLVMIYWHVYLSLDYGSKINYLKKSLPSINLGRLSYFGHKPTRKETSSLDHDERCGAHHLGPTCKGRNTSFVHFWAR
jgi:hypothetical protein